MKRLLLALALVAPRALGSAITYETTSGNTAGAVAKRDANGNFSANKLGLGGQTPTYVLDVKGTATQALTGTVSITAGTAAVTGAGTNFLLELAAGSSIKIGTQTLTVAAIINPSSLTLSANHTAGATGVTAYTDPDFIRVNNTANTNVFTLDRYGNLAIAGGLNLGGSLSPTSLAVGSSGDGDFTVQLTGTTTCVDVDCVGTGTAYSSELRAGYPILDPVATGQYLFISSIADNTHFTLVQAAPVFGDMTDATVFTTNKHFIDIRTPVFTDGSSSLADFVYVDYVGRSTFTNYWGIGPVVSITMGGNGNGPALVVPAGSTGLGTITPTATLDVAGNVKLGTAGVAFTGMGACGVASTTLSTTATNLTCTGVPASTGVAVTCSGAAAFSVPTGDAVYCRATGTLNQIACNTVVANTQAMTFKCMWVQP